MGKKQSPAVGHAAVGLFLWQRFAVLTGLKAYLFKSSFKSVA